MLFKLLRLYPSEKYAEQLSAVTVYRDDTQEDMAALATQIKEAVKKPVRAGDVVTMRAGCKHTIIAETELKVIEVQMGKEISIHDKQKFPLEEF